MAGTAKGDDSGDVDVSPIEQSLDAQGVTDSARVASLADSEVGDVQSAGENAASEGQVNLGKTVADEFEEPNDVSGNIKDATSYITEVVEDLSGVGGPSGQTTTVVGSAGPIPTAETATVTDPIGALTINGVAAVFGLAKAIRGIGRWGSAPQPPNEEAPPDQ